MTNALYAALGVDVGTTNSKVVVAETFVDGSVREAFVRSVATPAHGAGLLAAVLASIATATASYPHAIDAVGIASMAETGVLVDRDGEPLGDLLRWCDGDERIADELVASAGAAELYEATGVPVAAKSLPAQWIRLRRDDDPRLATARWCGVADLIATALSGSWATDHTLAARTMAYRSVPLGAAPETAFDADLLALAGIALDRLPVVLPPGTAAGALTRSAAAATGLIAGIPVVIAGHDHAVGAWAAGVRGDGQAADSVGTAEALFRVSEKSVPRSAARAAGMSVGRTVDGDRESLLAGNPTAGALVEWTLRTMFPDADRETLFAAAEVAVAGAPGGAIPLVLPYLRGRQSPAPDPLAVFEVLGRRGEPASLPADPGAALACILRGLVLQLAWADATQTEVLGAPRHPVLPVLGGPGASNGAWLSLKRAILPGRPRPIMFAEPVGTGAALLAARAITGLSPVLGDRDVDGGSDSSDDPATSPTGDAAALLDDFIAAALNQPGRLHREEGTP